MALTLLPPQLGIGVLGRHTDPGSDPVRTPRSAVEARPVAPQPRAREMAKRARLGCGVLAGGGATSAAVGRTRATDAARLVQPVIGKRVARKIGMPATTLLPAQLQRGALAYSPRVYNSIFALTESAISENGSWRSGAREGATHSDMATNGSLAYGTQPNGGTQPPYNDSCACLSGFGSNHRAQATIHIEAGNISSGGSEFHELELLVRCAIAANSVRCYEFIVAWDGAYGGWVRWNGALNDFTTSAAFNFGGLGHTPATGHVMRAEIAGNVLRGYVDWQDGNGWTLIQQVDITTDSAWVSDRNIVWTDGNPGMGHWNIGSTSTVTALAFSSYSAVTL